MKQQGKQTKRGTSDRPPTVTTGKVPAPTETRETDASTAIGVAKQAQEPDTGRGAIDHHQSNHGRRER